nr:hypothetical protein [Tanacetum cinerariifolium]
MPTGKIGVYTRFFEFANFRLPLSTFLVNVLRHDRINLSQLSVIAAAKVSYFEILCCVHDPDSDAVCYTKPLSSLKRWNDHFFWIDSFACPASFPWHIDKNVSREPFSKSTEFSADDYVVLVAHPAPFRKFLEPFLCLIGMSRNYTLYEDTYPTFLRDDGTEMDLFAFIQVADPTKSELEASVERLFDEGGSVDQEDFAAGGGQDAGTGYDN